MSQQVLLQRTNMLQKILQHNRTISVYFNPLNRPIPFFRFEKTFSYKLNNFDPTISSTTMASDITYNSIH